MYILTSVDIKSESPDCYSNHALRMVEELDGFSVQRKVILVLNGKRKSTLCVTNIAVPLHTMYCQKQPVEGHARLFKNVIMKELSF